MKIWRETLYQIADKAGLSVGAVCEMMGNTKSALPKRLMNGSADFKKVEVLALCSILGCTEKELGAIPVSPTAKRDNEDLHALIADGFKMIHTDLRNLIETMDKYWKPDPPKYQVKDVEQS